MYYLKQSTAANINLGPFRYASNGLYHDGLTINNADIWISKQGAAPVHPSLSVTLVAQTQGVYAMSVGTGDTNTRGNMLIWIATSLALGGDQEALVLHANAYDSWISATDYLDVNAVQGAGVSLAVATDIADAVWNETSDGHTTAGYAGEQLWTNVPAILADTGTDGVLLGASAIEASTIATGAIASSAFVAGAIDAAALNTDAVAEIAAAVNAPAASGIATEVLAGLVDGSVTLAVAMKNVNAYAKGNVVITSNTYVYKAADESTTVFTHELSTDARTVS